MPDNRPTPVVLLHGAGMMPTMWQSQVEALGAERRAIAPWIAGLRPGRRFELSLRTASAEVIGTLDGSGYAKAALVAHQLGAMVALQAAADHPERIDRLVVSGATLLPGKLALRLQKAAIRVMPAARLAQTGATKDDLVKALDVMAEADFSQRLGEIVPPTLVIVGQGDDLDARRVRIARLASECGCLLRLVGRRSRGQGNPPVRTSGRCAARNGFRLQECR